MSADPLPVVAQTLRRFPFPPQLINGLSRITLAQPKRLRLPLGFPKTLRRIQSKDLLLYNGNTSQFENIQRNGYDDS